MEPPAVLQTCHDCWWQNHQARDGNLACPPCNIGPLSTPNYPSSGGRSRPPLGSGRKVFAGQRGDGFYVDLGAIFDLGDLRPLANLHATFGLPKLAAAKGVDSTRYLNVHSIAIQVPISDLTRNGEVTRGRPRPCGDHRGLDDCQSPQGPGMGQHEPGLRRQRPLGADLPPRATPSSTR